MMAGPNRNPQLKVNYLRLKGDTTRLRKEPKLLANFSGTVASPRTFDIIGVQDFFWNIGVESSVGFLRSARNPSFSIGKGLPILRQP